MLPPVAKTHVPKDRPVSKVLRGCFCVASPNIHKVPSVPTAEKVEKPSAKVISFVFLVGPTMAMPFVQSIAIPTTKMTVGMDLSVNLLVSKIPGCVSPKGKKARVAIVPNVRSWIVKAGFVPRTTFAMKNRFAPRRVNLIKIPARQAGNVVCLGICIATCAPRLAAVTLARCVPKMAQPSAKVGSVSNSTVRSTRFALTNAAHNNRVLVDLSVTRQSCTVSPKRAKRKLEKPVRRLKIAFMGRAQVTARENFFVPSNAPRTTSVPTGLFVAIWSLRNDIACQNCRERRNLVNPVPMDREIVRPAIVCPIPSMVRRFARSLVMIKIEFVPSHTSARV
jgi:hypothetical protein